jgi:hypothetical protein
VITISADTKALEQAVHRMNGNEVRLATKEAMRRTAEIGAHTVANFAKLKLALLDTVPLIAPKGRGSIVDGRNPRYPIRYMVSRFQAVIVVRHIRILSRSFRSTSDESGVTVWFWKGQAPAHFKHAFYARFHDKARGWHYMRVHGKTVDARDASRGGRMVKGGFNRRGYTWRFPLKIVKGPSVHDAISVPETARRIQNDLSEIAQEEMATSLMARSQKVKKRVRWLSDI